MTETIDFFSSKKKVVDQVTDSVTSPHSKRAYFRALKDFLRWYDSRGGKLDKATIQAYRVFLAEAGRSPSSINQAMSAIRKFACIAADNGLFSPRLADEIHQVKGVRQSSSQVGNWLTKQQAQMLLQAPDVSTLKGLRDRAILAFMIGGGLRRSEVTDLNFDQIQTREARWVIADLVGKGGRARTVPIPKWAKSATDEWMKAADLEAQGHVFRPVNKGGKLSGESMTPQAIYNVVDEYARVAGMEITPHDLRLTYAKLAHEGGAALDQIQLTLGHASIQTTERFIGVEQNLYQAPCDALGLEV